MVGRLKEFMSDGSWLLACDRPGVVAPRSSHMILGTRHPHQRLLGGAPVVGWQGVGGSGVEKLWSLIRLNSGKRL